MDFSKLRQVAASLAWPLAAAIVIVGLLAWGLLDTTEEIQAPFVEAGPGVSSDMDEEEDVGDTLMSDPVADIYQTDSAFLSLDTAYSLSPERRGVERQRLQRAELAFRQQYTKVAKGILASVYTPELLFGDRDTFLQASSQAMQRLVLLASSLGRQYELDPTTAEAIGGEVIGQVTDQLREAAMRQQ